jgi:hypothetical protein
MNTDPRATVVRITDLAQVIDAKGIHADPVELLLVAHAARDLGVDEFLVGLMVDEGEPEVARMRAFGHVASRVRRRLDAELVNPTERVLLAAS